MAGICINSIPKSHATDGHRVVTVTLDGETITDEFFDEDFDALTWNDVLPSDWRTLTLKQIFVRLGVKKKRLEGVTFNQLIGRVTNGEEATNVKQYDFIAPGSAVTKNNIGTAYVDVLPGANGQRVLVDCTGCTQFRIVVTANLVATGPFQARVVKDSDSMVLYESPSLTQTGERELDTDWQTLPAWATGMEVLRLQAKSATASDDPVFRRCVMLLR